MSSINPNNINGQYPVAGQDNDSQGFRDNFTNIKNNFTFAYNEISELQQNAVLKRALVGGTINNDLAYNQIYRAQLIAAAETTVDLGEKVGPVTIDFLAGHFQFLQATGAVVLSFTNWATSPFYGKLRVQITASNPSTTVTFPAEVSVNLSSIQGASGQVVTLPDANVPYIFELSSYNGGAVITVTDLLRNYGTTGNVTAPVVSVTSQLQADNITSATSANTVTISGNLKFNGAQIQSGYQQSKPTANVAVTVANNVNRLLITPTSVVVSFGANVTLPNVIVDGTIVNIVSNVSISQLDVRPGWNGVVSVSPAGNLTSVAAGSASSYMYVAADLTWYKIA